MLLLIVVGVMAVQVSLQARLAQAGGNQQSFVQADKRNTQWVALPTPKSHMICGKLVYLAGYYPDIYGDPEVSTIGLMPCGGGSLLIFHTHPRQLVPYYQFRDPRLGTGEMICTETYGCIDQYLVTFRNYVGIDDCSACGKYNLPPTWTHVPLTPFTSTPIPPTKTPWPTPITPTATGTLSPGEITPTKGLLELLQGATATPTPGAISQLQPAMTGTPIAQAAPFTPGVTTTPAESIYQRIAPIGLILLALLALLIIPLISVLRDFLREREDRDR